MPSFDVVSQFDVQEVRNAVDQTAREASTRYDFKGTDSSIELSGEENDSDATEEQMGEEQRNNVLPANAKVVAEKEATRERIEKEKEKDETKMKILADGTVVEDHGEDDDLEIGGSMKTQDVGPR